MMSKKVLTGAFKTLLTGAGMVTVLLTAGCGSSELETGYKPRPLSSSDAQRRAFYAPQYSREAAMAAQQQQQAGGDASSMGRHRPGAPY